MPSTQFENLPQEKQLQIFEASLREFAAKGYDLASTNRIVELADISKGVLFKYFEDKASLFTYVCKVVFDEVLAQMPEVQDDDFFAFLQRATLQKIRFSKAHPLTYRLFMRIAKEPNHPVYASVLHIATMASQTYVNQLISLLPRQNLRDGVTWEHVLSLVTWVSNGLMDMYIARLPDNVDENTDEDYAPMLRELGFYFEIIKTGTYRMDGAR